MLVSGRVHENYSSWIHSKKRTWCWDGHYIPLPWFLSHQLLSHTKNLPSISNTFVYASFRTYLEWFLFPQPPKWVPKNCAKTPPARTKSSATIQTNSLLDMGFQERWRKGSLILIHPVVTETTSESSGEDPTNWRNSTPLGGVKIHKLFFLELRYQFTSSQVTCHAFRFAESSGHSRKSPPPSMGSTSRHDGKIQPIMCTSPTIAYASANIFQKSGHFPISYKYRLSSTKKTPWCHNIFQWTCKWIRHREAAVCDKFLAPKIKICPCGFEGSLIFNKHPQIFGPIQRFQISNCHQTEPIIQLKRSPKSPGHLQRDPT